MMQLRSAERTGSATTASGAHLPCHDPATGELLGHVPVMDDAAVAERVERARRAQAGWAATSFAERRRVLRAVLDAILADQREICRLASRDSGKTLVDAAMGEVFPVCEKLRYTIAHGERDLRPRRRSTGFLVHKRARVSYPPLGVIGVICPWNFPFHNIFCPVIPALFSGNAVVVKVSEWSSWSAADYIDIWHRALEACGHSRELVQLVTGYGETGAALVRSEVDKVFFTGSPKNGREVMRAAADGLTEVVLELGGKDPMIVCDDADLEQAVDDAMLGVFTACGQMCVAAERIYVQDSIHDAFVARAAERAAALRQGPPLRGDYDMGATTMPHQLEIIEALIEDAVERGARVVVGGTRNAEHGQGQFFAPTVITRVDHTMRIAREELFGPVMVIMRFFDDDHAVQLANDCAYGLGSSVFSRDRRRAERIASAIRSGMTVINDYGVAYMAQALPFGGVGISGFGRINGREGLRACCNTKAVVEDRIALHRGMSPYPTSEHSYDILEQTIALIYGRGLGARLRAAAGTARALVRHAAARRRP